MVFSDTADAHGNSAQVHDDGKEAARVKRTPRYSECGQGWAAGTAQEPRRLLGRPGQDPRVSSAAWGSLQLEQHRLEGL